MPISSLAGGAAAMQATHKWRRYTGTKQGAPPQEEVPLRSEPGTSHGSVLPVQEPLLNNNDQVR